MGNKKINNLVICINITIKSVEGNRREQNAEGQF